MPLFLYLTRRGWRSDELKLLGKKQKEIIQKTTDLVFKMDKYVLFLFNHKQKNY